MQEGDLVAGRYRLLRPIGAGAMGTVWAARHELLGRDLALKMATVGERDGRSVREARDLFLREVRIVGTLRHPNVVDIADAGEAGDDRLYLAMELLEGESLAQRIARAPLAPADAIAVAAEVCRGLAAAHAAGVVHRDLKPENVFLARGAAGGVVPKLLDFGVSSARGVATAHRGELFGTPAYMSPEQALGERDIDHRTDVWALGVVLYEMLTGELPFQAESYPGLLPRIIEAPYPPLPASIPPEVRTVVAGCLAKDRSDRYPTAVALLEAIERARDAIPAAEPGFLVETARGVTSPATVVDAMQVSRPARGARIRLVVAILALPVAIGIAAVATAMRTKAGTDPRALAHAPEPPPPASVVPAPTAPPAAPIASPTETASTAGPPAVYPGPPASSARPDASAKAGRRPAAATRSKVTKVDNAGF